MHAGVFGFRADVVLFFGELVVEGDAVRGGEAEGCGWLCVCVIVCVGEKNVGVYGLVFLPHSNN